MNILCCSGGNDSVALIQWAIETNLENVTVIFNDTGWSVDWWPARMAEIKSLCSSNGFKYAETKSEGMEALVKRKKGWPQCASKFQFCTYYLKTLPTLNWLTENDPYRNATIYIGVRQEESQNRANHPEEILFDSKYEGRLQRFPLVFHTEKDRDFLIEPTGIDILLHSSLECFPCCCSNRNDLRLLSKFPSKISEIDRMEYEMGFTSKGKPRVMFRPYRHMGATGIREIVKWALCERGKYKKAPAVKSHAVADRQGGEE